MNKKAFTIVELVIVIAVIAILAAVLIPTFSGVVEKANESSALQAATNMYKSIYALNLADNNTLRDGMVLESGSRAYVSRDNQLFELTLVSKKVKYNDTLSTRMLILPGCVSSANMSETDALYYLDGDDTFRVYEYDGYVYIISDTPYNDHAAYGTGLIKSEGNCSMYASAYTKKSEHDIQDDESFTNAVIAVAGDGNIIDFLSAYDISTLTLTAKADFYKDSNTTNGAGKSSKVLSASQVKELRNKDSYTNIKVTK